MRPRSLRNVSLITPRLQQMQPPEESFLGGRNVRKKFRLGVYFSPFKTEKNRVVVYL